jgi:quinol monooxygenase YgiN
MKTTIESKTISRAALVGSASAILGAFSLAVAAPLPALAAMASSADRKAGVTVIAKLTAKPGQEAALHDLFLGLVAGARAEPANISYDLVVSVDDPATFVSIECWKSADALQAHLKTAPVLAAIAKLPPIVAAPPSILSYKMVSDPA